MTTFMNSGTNFTPIADKDITIKYKLPPGVYAIEENPLTGALYLKEIEPFELPSKLYGDTQSTVNRIFTTFLDRNGSTGVLLSGQKGSGKTLVAKLLSAKAHQHQIPTIVIDRVYDPSKFSQLVQMLDQEVVLIFDEFEKVYDRDDQQAILSLLDGIYTTKKMFVLTCNDVHRIDSHLINRPGRVYYAIEYKGLSSAFVKEYAMDNLVDKQHVDAIQSIGALFADFSFDLLKAIVEEVNRYGETPQQALTLLNARPFGDGSEAEYRVQLLIDGVAVDQTLFVPNTWWGNPMKNHMCVELMFDPADKSSSKLGSHNKKDKPTVISRASVHEIGWDEPQLQRDDCQRLHDDDAVAVVEFSPQDLKKVLADVVVDGKRTDQFTFVNSDQHVLVLTKQDQYRFSFSSLAF